VLLCPKAASARERIGDNRDLIRSGDPETTCCRLGSTEPDCQGALGSVVYYQYAHIASELKALAPAPEPQTSEQDDSPGI
jgi:hypothetical protein